MIVNSKKVMIRGIEYTYISCDQSEDFVCDRCLKVKVGKKYANFVDKNGKTKKICNACYSNICQGK